MPLDSRRRALRWMARSALLLLASGQMEMGLVAVETEQGTLAPVGGGSLGRQPYVHHVSHVLLLPFIGTFINE